MRLGLRGKFLLPILLTVFAGMTVSVSLSYLRATAGIEEAVKSGMEREVRLTVRHIDHWLGNRRSDSMTWSRKEVFRDAIVEHGYYGKSARQAANHDLVHLQQGYPYYRAIAVITESGDVIAASDFSNAEGTNVKNRPYFRQAIRGLQCVSDVFSSKVDNSQMFAVASPIYDDGRVVGVLACFVDLHAFSSQFVDDFKLRNGFAYIVDSRGRVFASSLETNDRLVDLGRYAFGREMLRRNNGSIVYMHSGTQRIASFQSCEQVGWMFVVAQSLDSALASTRAAGKYGALVGLVVLLLVILIIGYLFRRSIQTRLDELLFVIERVDAGDLDARVEDALVTDEVGAVTRAFNMMTSRLKRTLIALNDEIRVRTGAEKELAAHRDRLEEIVEERTRELTVSNAELRQTIADREKAKAALEKARDAAEAANRAKSEFLANMSHEIRTPMTAILGFADMMLDASNESSAVSDVQADAVQTIRRNGEYLLGIINDILDLSKIEAGRMTIERIDCSPVEIMTEIANLIGVRADAKGLSFNVRCEGPVPETISTDPTRLRQILINLIGNAIKFTESGGVTLIARCQADSDPAMMEFDVADTGVGMTEQQVTALFQPFMQADSSTTRRFGGTGLGLTISQRFANLLGGGIRLVETSPGKGSIFCVRIAVGSLEGVRMITGGADEHIVRRTPRSTKSTEEVERLDGCRVLFAEDGPDNQRLVSHFLRKAGAEVTIVSDGKQAVDAALDAKRRREPYQVILMDMQMPVMDGYVATSQLREEGYAGAIIALTAHAMTNDRTSCIAAGCDEYLTKPINRKRLLRVVYEHWRRSPQPVFISD